MTDYTYHSDLPVIDYEYPKAISAEINSFISGLKPKDLDNEDNFTNTLEGIKKKYLPTPVVFEQPKIVDHREEERRLKPDYNFPVYRDRIVYSVEVEIKFSGSIELFNYKPNGYSYMGNDMYIYQPINNVIKLEIESLALEKAKILDEVRNKMNLTYQFIDSNNEFAKKIIATQESEIERKLKLHKEKVDNLYS